MTIAQSNSGTPFYGILTVGRESDTSTFLISHGMKWKAPDKVSLRRRHARHASHPESGEDCTDVIDIQSKLFQSSRTDQNKRPDGDKTYRLIARP